MVGCFSVPAKVMRFWNTENSLPGVLARFEPDKMFVFDCSIGPLRSGGSVCFVRDFGFRLNDLTICSVDRNDYFDLISVNLRRDQEKEKESWRKFNAIFKKTDQKSLPDG